MVCFPHRVRSIFNLLGDRLSTMAGIRLHEGKTRVWNKAGECPEEIAELGHSSSGEFVARVVAERLVCGTRCLESLTCSAHGKCWCSAQDPDATTSCAHCHHPKQGSTHDLGMMQAMESLLGGLTGEVSHRLWAHHLASLPMRLGGLAASPTNGRKHCDIFGGQAS